MVVNGYYMVIFCFICYYNIIICYYYIINYMLLLYYEILLYVIIMLICYGGIYGLYGFGYGWIGHGVFCVMIDCKNLRTMMYYPMVVCFKSVIIIRL